MQSVLLPAKSKMQEASYMFCFTVDRVLASLICMKIVSAPPRIRANICFQDEFLSVFGTRQAEMEEFPL